MSSKRNHGQGEGGRHQALATVATEQGGLVAVNQLRLAGISRSAASHRAREGGFHRVHRGVYAVGHRSLGQVEMLQAALLACGEEAVISHLTAAAFWGLRDRWPVLVDVAVPSQAGRKIDGIRCRRCRRPGRDEILVRDGVTCTTPARTLVDSAGSLGISSLRRMVERAAVLKLLDLDALDRSLRDARGRRGMRALRAILGDWRTGDDSTPDVRSDFEALILPRLVAMGLPRPTCNRPLWVGGERLTVDFLWEQQRVVVEPDGAASHQTPVAFQRDRWRDQLLTADGYRVARITWHQIAHEPDAVVSRIARTLRLAAPQDGPVPPVVP